MIHFNFTPFPILHTERLLLRNMEYRDLDDFFSLRNNDQVHRYIDRPKQTLEETDEILKKVIAGVENNESISWAVCLKNDPKLIGTIGFWRTNRENHRAEIGYSLFPEYWNTGMMTEAMHPVIQYGFEVMNLHSIEADINPENGASRRLLEKCGFVQEAHFRENLFYNGRYIDSAIFCMLYADYKKG